MLQASATDAAGGIDNATDTGDGAAILGGGASIGGGRHLHRWEADLQGGHAISARRVGGACNRSCHVTGEDLFFMCQGGWCGSALSPHGVVV
jgi:hypothetical protein